MMWVVELTIRTNHTVSTQLCGLISIIFLTRFSTTTILTQVIFRFFLVNQNVTDSRLDLLKVTPKLLLENCDKVVENFGNLDEHYFKFVEN